MKYRSTNSRRWVIKTRKTLKVTINKGNMCQNISLYGYFSIRFINKPLKTNILIWTNYTTLFFCLIKIGWEIHIFV